MTTCYRPLARRLSLRIALVLLVGFLLSSTAAAQYLYNRMDLPTGLTPVALVAADFNGDGLLDLAVANRDDNTVSILLAKPDGTFAPQVTYATGLMPMAILAADFDGDGKLDLAVSDFNCTSFCGGAGLISILLGNGDGTFEPAVNYPVGSQPAGVVAADFNGDGKVDLAVTNQNDSTTSILLGNGDGTFQSQTLLSLAGPTATGDFNGDGKIDLAIIAGGGLSVLLNDGQGTFRRVDTPLPPYGSTGIAVGDFNGDGKLDVVVGDTSTLGAYQPQVLLGNGDGTFQIQPSTALSANFATCIIAADFNHDGILDLAFSGAGAAIALGNGDGTFQMPVQTVPVATGSPFAPTVIGDFNGDGQLDLAEVNSSEGTVAILLGIGDGTFGHESNFAIAPSGWTGPEVVADFDGDGKPDVAVRTTPGTVSGGSVAVLLGHGDGTLANPVSSLAGSAGLYAMAFGDFNGDGEMDVAVDDGNSVSVLLGNGDGSLQSPLSTLVGVTLTVQRLVAGDFNGDGKLDLGVIANDSNGTFELVILLGNGSGSFAIGASYTLTTTISSVVEGDFNKDGKLDLAVLDWGVPQALVLIGNGDGSFRNPFSYAIGAQLLAVADVDGDGNLDLVGAAGSSVSVLLGNGDGTFKSHLDSIFSGSSYGIRSLAIADFNGDGKPDVATDGGGGGAVILLGKGDGTFQEPLGYQSNSSASVVAAGDFNGDGTPDLAIADVMLTPTEPTVTLLLSTPTVNLAPSRLTFASRTVGTSSAARPVTLTNIGNAPLALTTVTVTGDFGETNTCGGTIAIGMNCVVSVNFTPTAGGPRTGSLTFADNALASPQHVALAGAGLGPVAALSPGTLTFSSQVVGSTSAAQTVTLSNSGSGALVISNIAISGDFAQTNTCGGSVATNASCTVNVTFTPIAPGSRTGSIAITDNAGNSPQTIGLTGTGVGPAAGLSPTALMFSGQLLGSTSSAKSVTLSNSGNAPLSLTGIAASGDFAQTNTCSTSLAVGATCTISITFTPTAGGNRTGSITLTDNAGNSPQTVTLAGTGEDFTLAVPSGSSPTASVSPGQPANYSLSFSGLGGLNQAINFTCTGAPSEATCTVNPTSATPSASGSIAVTVTVTTTAPSLAAPVDRRTPPFGPRSGLRFLSILLLGLFAAVSWAFGFARRQPQSRKLRWGLGTAALAMLALAMAACGGGGGGVIHDPGTPAGTYTLTVTGATSGSANLRHSVTLSLKVG